jgi:AcrR family transcriptional regulator
MADADSISTGRALQKKRTRQALLDAASRLMREGRDPTLDEVAEAAMVSRATFYRYFTGVEPLLVEATLDVAMPPPDVLAGAPADDPVARLRQVDAAVDAMIRDNEPGIRRMLIHSLQQALAGTGGNDLPARQNRRTPLIEAALEPVRDRFDPDALGLLTNALALLIGSESRLVFRDVLQLDDAEARRVKDWAIRALVEAARRPGA